MNKKLVEEKILEMLRKTTGNTYDLEQDLMGEGCLSSIELMELIVDVEQEFKIKIPSRKLRFVVTVEDLVGLVCERAGIA